MIAGSTPVLVHNIDSEGCVTPVKASNSYGGDIKQQGWNATLNKWGDAEFTIRAPQALRDQGITGSTMFGDAVQALGGIDNIQQINGVWNAGELGDNLNSFNDALNSNPGMTPEQAAFETFTGKMATRSGFTSVEVDLNAGESGNYTEIFARFRRG